MKKHQKMQNLFGYQSEEDEANSTHDLNHQDNSFADEEQEPENEGKAKSGGAEINRRGKLKGVHYDHLGSSRSPENDEGKNPALSSAAVIHEVFGDSGDDEPAEHAAHDWINENNRSPNYKKNHADESPVENIIPDEGAPRESEEEGRETKLKGTVVTIDLSSQFGIAHKQFDPATYVEEDFYVTDESGSRRRIPPTNIIRWRKVRNPDGTTSVESNARIVTWSDGSLQLLIGNEAFDLCELDKTQRTFTHICYVGKKRGATNPWE